MVISSNLNTWILDLDATSDEKIEYVKIINDLFLFVSELKYPNFLLNMRKKEYSFVETFIHDIALYHFHRLGIKDIENKFVSFWFKSQEYNFEQLHLHLDHDDYEYHILKTHNIKPITSSLTYFNDNDSPTLITEITKEMLKSNTFCNEFNTKMSFSFPTTMKHISFDSGNYYHGETYINKCQNISKRYVLVIALSDENNQPLHIPYFDNDLFLYWRFISMNKEIKKDLRQTNTSIIKFISTEKEIIIIPITDNKIINESFFHSLIVEKDKKSIYPLAKYINKYKNKGTTFILDFSYISLKKPNYMHAYLKNELRSYDIIFQSDYLKNYCIQTFNKNSILWDKRYLLDMHKETFNIIEKLVYDIAKFHLQSYSLMKDYFVSFFIQSKENNVCFIDNCKIDKDILMKPILSTITYLNDIEKENDISILTDIDEEHFKFKLLTDSNKIVLSFPKMMRHISFDGGNYYHLYNKGSLIIQIWCKKPNILNYNDKTYDDNFGRNDDFVVLKKVYDNEKIIEVNDGSINKHFMEKILYTNNFKNNDESISKQFIEKSFYINNVNNDILILKSNNIENIENKCMDDTNKSIITKMHFDTPIYVS